LAGEGLEVFYDEQKEMVENGSGAIRALSRTKVFLSQPIHLQPCCARNF
jgi:hypothetical protein